MYKKDFYSFYILIGTLLYMVSISGTRPLIPLFSQELGANNAEIGVIVTLYSLVPLFISIILGKVIDKKGTKLPLIISIFIGFLALFIPYAFQDIVGIYLSQIFAGISQLIFVLSIQSYAASIADTNKSEYYISIFSIGVALGGFSGPILSGVLSDLYNYPVTILILGILIVLCLPFSFFLNSKVNTRDKLNYNTSKRGQNSIDLLKNSKIRRVIIISGLLLLGKDIYIAFFPLLGKEMHLSNAMIGVIIAINAAGGLVIRIVLPIILKNYNYSRIMILSLNFVGILYMITPIFNHLVLLMIISFFIGLFLGIGQPLSIVATANALPSERTGEGLGLRLTFNRMTQVVSPTILGGVSIIFGTVSVFYLTGLTILLGALFSRKK